MLVHQPAYSGWSGFRRGPEENQADAEGRALDEPVSGSAVLDPPRFALRKGRLVPARAGPCTLAETLQQRLAADPRSVGRHSEDYEWNAAPMSPERMATL